jgi:EF hand
LHRTLTLCDLRNMDTNEDGAVDREEFILFMLQALQKVDRSTVQKLRDIFDSLDTNGNGILEYDDLIEISRANCLPALEQVEEAVLKKHADLLDLPTGANHNHHYHNGRHPVAVTTGHHRRNHTSP